MLFPGVLQGFFDNYSFEAAPLESGVKNKDLKMCLYCEYTKAQKTASCCRASSFVMLYTRELNANIEAMLYVTC